MDRLPCVLIVEDESNIRSSLRAVLSSNGYRVLEACDGRQAAKALEDSMPDLLLLDLGLPDMDGLEIIRRTRGIAKIPIVVLSARDHEKDKVAALDLGADDYVTKPFATSELLARLRVALRHGMGESTGAIEAYQCGGLLVDMFHRRIQVDGRAVHLTPNEYDIVTLLASHPGRVLTYDFIIGQVWGPDDRVDNQILRVNMANIRRKLEKNPATPEYILTEIGVGYRMAEDGEIA